MKSNAGSKCMLPVSDKPSNISMHTKKSTPWLRSGHCPDLLCTSATTIKAKWRCALGRCWVVLLGRVATVVREYEVLWQTSDCRNCIWTCCQTCCMMGLLFGVIPCLHTIAEQTAAWFVRRCHSTFIHRISTSILRICSEQNALTAYNVASTVVALLANLFAHRITF